MVVIGGFYDYLHQTTALIKYSAMGGHSLHGAFFEWLWVPHGTLILKCSTGEVVSGRWMVEQVCHGGCRRLLRLSLPNGGFDKMLNKGGCPLDDAFFEGLWAPQVL
ncbi:hypothetical protein JCGZ_11039 [Jatropha curcas]|uniref:Uncharacterized protein n=1 Tax=Jatropha curcas TaxID=180498 RepID=A0A067KTA0_JATCU|nr:hypothetical protein JCGZ_11039 [Jatropha curcas]